MSYDTPNAFRMALEQRLLSRSNATGLALDRLRRRVVFERIVARLQRAEPGRWVLKGGMALEVRLRDNARLTKDIDLGLRDEVLDADELRDRLVEALGEDPDGDRFVLTVGPAKTMVEDGSGLPTWRLKVKAELAGKLFGGIQVDVSPRLAELTKRRRWNRDRTEVGPNQASALGPNQTSAPKDLGLLAGGVQTRG